MKLVQSSHTDACDTRLEVVVDDVVVNHINYPASMWVRANRVYGVLASRGHHVRLVSVGLVEHTISEMMSVDGEHRVVSPCPVCGVVCSNSHVRDSLARQVIADHAAGKHDSCNPIGCANNISREAVELRRK